MLERGFLREDRQRPGARVEALSGKRMNFRSRYGRQTLPSGAKVPVYSGIAMIIASVILMLVFWKSAFVGKFTIGVFAGVASIYLGLIMNGFFKAPKDRTYKK